MKLLINIFGGLVLSIPVLALASIEKLVDMVAIQVNWSLGVVLFLSALIISTLVKKEKNDQE